MLSCDSFQHSSSMHFDHSGYGFGFTGVFLPNLQSSAEQMKLLYLSIRSPTILRAYKPVN
jgi:hypothetical protein